MSNSIRAAALDAAIVATLKTRTFATLDGLHDKLWTLYLTPPMPAEGKREIRHRLQRLQSAGTIKQAGRGKWVLA